MTWLAQNFDKLAPLVGVGAGLIADKQNKSAVVGAANRTLPYSSTSDYGSVSFGDGGFDISTQGSPFATLMQQLATAGAANYGATTNDPMAALPPAIRAQLETATGQNAGAAAGAFGALQDLGFDPRTAAENRYQLLSSQARPGEDRARMSLEDRLFQQGRLGTSGGGIATESLLNAQGQADIGRQLAGADYAMGLQRQLGDLATTFSTTATNTGLSGLNAAEARRTNMLTGAQGANAANMNIFQSLLNQANTGIAAGGGQQFAADQLAKRATAGGDMYADIFKQLIPAAGDWLKRRYGG